MHQFSRAAGTGAAALDLGQRDALASARPGRALGAPRGQSRGRLHGPGQDVAEQICAQRRVADDDREADQRDLVAAAMDELIEAIVVERRAYDRLEDLSLGVRWALTSTALGQVGAAIGCRVGLFQARSPTGSGEHRSRRPFEVPKARR